MTPERKKAVFKDCLRQFAMTFILYLLNMAVIMAVFLLYALNTEPFLFVFAVSLLILLIIFGIHFLRQLQKAEIRSRKSGMILSEWNDLPAPESLSRSKASGL